LTDDGGSCHIAVSMSTSAPRSARAVPNGPLDVVCFGEVLWDIYEQTSSRGGGGRGGRDERIARDFRREMGGACGNVATGLARLGVRSALVGGIGLDAFGDAIERELREDGVRTRFLIRMPNRTGITFVTRDDVGEPSFLFYRQDTADVSVRPEQVTREMGRAKWVLVGTSTMMTPTLAAATDRFLSFAEEAGARIVVDLNVREHLWASKAEMRAAVAQLVRRASIVKGSFVDLIAITGRRDILWLADHAPRAAWIVTQGSKGASALGDHGFVASPARKAKCVDATGAGDAFIAGVLAVLLAAGAEPGNAAWRDERVWGAALQAGHVMGAKAISRVGSVSGLVDLGEALAIIKAVGALQPRKPEGGRRTAATKRGRKAKAKAKAPKAK
jgi:fructokinase